MKLVLELLLVRTLCTHDETQLGGDLRYLGPVFLIKTSKFPPALKLRTTRFYDCWAQLARMLLTDIELLN
eukprot:scaffold226108_cov15-Tisochrysis_lutea.AAC.1